MNAEHEQLLAESQLLKRGWTKALISRFLGDPDELKTNPYYRSWPLVRLYKMQRVEQAELSTEYRAAQANRKGRRDAAQKGVATKKKRIADYVDNIIIEVPHLAKDELIRRACDNYTSEDEWGDDWADELSDPEFLELICVNYLRDHLTPYETRLSDIAGKVGARDAYFTLNVKVLEAIADEYEWLSDECHRQKPPMWNSEAEFIET